MQDSCSMSIRPSFGGLLELVREVFSYKRNLDELNLSNLS